MAAITDKFGRPSIPTNYAVATTVKTARTAGESVLSAFDLSKFAIDAPAFFITYKKTTDPVTGEVSVTNQRSWKALVNPDNNTLTNLTLAPGYTDGNLDVGDFIECIPSSYWGNELVDGILAHANPDGSLKTSAVNTALGITGTTPPDWTALPAIPTMVSSDGQRQHKIRYTGVDYRPTIGEGTKLRIPRTGTTPTTSMAFVSASSQYASKTAPAGLTFTDDFTCEAWVYLENYGNHSPILTRYNGTSQGWEFSLESSGTVRLAGYNSTGRQVVSYQSVPLNTWVHVAATLDMSANTGKVYIDGAEVPVLMGGTPTALVQGTADLQVGARNSTLPFNGKIANAKVWSTIRTAAQIRDNMNQETPASTTGLVAHFKGNGSWNDSSTNANHLTPVNGAVNNFASHPYSATEYAIVTKVEYTASNTDVTVFTGSNCLPNETLGATSYSTARAPYGFPASRDKWSLFAYNRSDSTFGIGSASLTYFAFPGLSIQAPQGEWRLSCQVGLIYQTSTAASIVGRTAVTTESVAPLAQLNSSGLIVQQFSTRWGGGPNATELNVAIFNSVPLSVSSPTNYKFAVREESGAGNFSVRHAGLSAEQTSYMRLECAYL